MEKQKTKTRRLLPFIIIGIIAIITMIFAVTIKFVDIDKLGLEGQKTSSISEKVVVKEEENSTQENVMKTSMPAPTALDVKREISGKVWFDANKDGIINDGEDYMEGVKVTLLKNDGTPAQNLEGSTIEPVQTDSEGYYCFQNMAKAIYKVKIECADLDKEITLKGQGEDPSLSSKFNENKETDLIETFNVDDVESILKEQNVNAGIAYLDAQVIVHHYIINTETKVPSKNGGQVEDVVINGVINKDYTTEVSKDVVSNYRFVERTKNYSGKMQEDPIYVTYYYRLVDAEIDPQITKTATESIEREGDPITYKIRYNTTIDKYAGSAVVTVKDYLPEEIDEENMEIDGGNYNSEDRSITWTEEFKGIDTYEDGRKDIVISKTITVVYKNPAIPQNIVNKAEGTVVLPETSQQKRVETQAETVQDYRIDVKVNTVWKDNNIQKQRRPEKVMIELYANGVFGQNKEITASEDTSYTFKNLEKYDEEGEEITYTIKEIAVNEGQLYFYRNTVDNHDMLNQTVTNTFTRPEDKIEIQVRKIWVDGNDIYGRRPESITLILKDEKDNVIKQTVTSTEEWKHQFTQLYKYDENGIEKSYVIDEEEVHDKDLYFYSKKINNDSYTITNTFTVPEDKIQVKVDNIWNDGENQYSKRPENVRLLIYGDGIEVQSTIIGLDENWTYTFKDLRKYDSVTGKEIVYTIRQEEVRERGLFFYQTEINNSDMLNQTITNNFYVPDVRIEIPTSKKWQDYENVFLRRPDSVEMILYGENKQELERQVISEENNWSYVFTNLPQYNSVTGDEIKYTIDEAEITNDDVGVGVPDDPNGNIEKSLKFYTKEIDNDRYIITNTFAVPDDRLDIEVNKEWLEDNENEYEKRPTGIVAVLYANGDEQERYVITEEDEWKHTFTNVRKYQEITGYDIEYTIGEAENNEGDLLYYDQEIDGNTIKNTFKVTNIEQDPSIEKTGTTKITRKDEELNYKIIYKNKINGYIGNAQITITDYLPYEIDEEKSDILEGTYDKENKTITWVENIDNINTFANGEQEINIQKDIKVVYKDIDVKLKTLENKVEGNIFLDTTKVENKVESSSQTQVDFKFNLKITKQLSQIIKNNNQEKITDNKVQKVTVNRKETKSTSIKTKYLITVENTGSLIGSGTIEEKIPANMKFIAKESNSKWYEENGKIKAKTGELAPGEEIKLEVSLEWTGGDAGYGLLENKAEIVETENEAEFEEESKEDNIDVASIVVEISTGEETYIILAIGAMLLLLATGGIIYQLKAIKKEE